MPEGRTALLTAVAGSHSRARWLLDPEALGDSAVPAGPVRRS